MNDYIKKYSHPVGRPATGNEAIKRSVSFDQHTMDLIQGVMGETGLGLSHAIRLMIRQWESDRRHSDPDPDVIQVG